MAFIKGYSPYKKFNFATLFHYEGKTVYWSENTVVFKALVRQFVKWLTRMSITTATSGEGVYGAQLTSPTPLLASTVLTPCLPHPLLPIPSLPRIHPYLIALKVACLEEDTGVFELVVFLTMAR